MTLNSSLFTAAPEARVDAISAALRQQVFSVLRRKGAVVLVSGGIDSSVCAALCARALGKERVLAVALPERDSSPESQELARLLAERLHLAFRIEDISPALQGLGCYDRQEEAIRMVVPGYDRATWKSKIILPSILDSERLNIPRLVVEDPDGRVTTHRMAPESYLHLVAATNFKQRVRTTIGYYHADRLHYALCGTPNRLEYDQGFFVKGGDGLADVKPIAHLYKTEVYELARYLGLPDEIVRREPTTDTFSLAQSQEEFYFSLPYQKMDLCLYAHNQKIPAAETAEAVRLTPDQVERVYADIEAKRRHTLPLHLGPLLCEEVPEIAELTRAAGRPIR